MQTIQAAHYHVGRLRPVRVVVIHDMEAPEETTTAENVARYFAGPSAPLASTHICVDSDSEVRCVADEDTAWAAPGCNSDGLQIEHAGYARQTTAEWLDVYSRAMLRRSAVLVAAWCHKYDLPPVHLTAADLLAGKRGITGHADVTNAYHQSDHTDPGTGFPWDWYLGLVKAELAKLPGGGLQPTTVVVKTSVWAAMRAAGLAVTTAAVAAVLAANHIADPTKVQPGQTITIPSPLVTASVPVWARPTPTPTVTPTPKPTVPAPPPFPGRQYFRDGAYNTHVTDLGRQLVKRGYGRFYAVGPGPRWSNSDRNAVRAFQLNHSQLAGAADGYPGPLTWRFLFATSKGK